MATPSAEVRQLSLEEVKQLNKQNVVDASDYWRVYGQLQCVCDTDQLLSFYFFVDQWPRCRVVLSVAADSGDPFTAPSASIRTVSWALCRRPTSGDGEKLWRERGLQILHYMIDKTLFGHGWNALFFMMPIPVESDWLLKQVNCPGYSLEDTFHCLLLQAPDLSATTCTLPEGYRYGPISPDHADFVHATWAFGKDEHTHALVRRFLAQFPSLGAWPVDDEGGPPVAHVLHTDHGTLGMLHVAEAHRRKGLASVLTARLAQQVQAKHGRRAAVYIDDYNQGSLQLHLKLGFTVLQQRVDLCTFYD